MNRFLPLVLALAVASPALAQTAPQRVTPQSRADVLYSYSPLVKRVQPAVVNVYASRVDRQPRNPLFDDPIFRRFFGQDAPSSRTQQSLGSGVIVDPAGLIVTNHHVIEGMTQVKVSLSDRRELDAEIVLRDPRTDLAVLRVKSPAPLPFVELGDSDSLEVGDIVLALGNPFGVGQTVTQGIVSALARTQVGITDYGFFIQTDAAINPGNSGGALSDMQGRLVGINSAIYSRSGGSIGIGFAIPVNMVKIVVDAARGGVERVRRPWVGATMQGLSREIAESIGLDRPIGGLVTAIRPDSPAAEAGLRRGDVVSAVDGVMIEDPEGFGYRIGTKAIGGSVTLDVLRGGKPQKLTMRLAAAPETPARDTVKLENRSPFSGATVMNLSPAVAEELSVETTSEGVVVAEIADGSNAANVGVQRGDIIREVNDERVSTTRELARLTAARRPFWKLSIQRGGQIFTTVLGG